VAEFRLETERLILRPPHLDDLAWQLTWLNTPEVMRHLGGVVHPVEKYAAGFQRNAAAMAKGEPAFWTAVLRSSGEPVGKCGLSPIESDEAPPALAGGIQVGWTLAEPFWGRGLASEAARAAIGHGFAVFALPAIWAQTSASNAASTRMMARLRLLRCAELDYHDPDYPAADNPTTIYRVVREDWAAPA
jgi:RimJ/RimL family protein N-acetyltransferase